MHPSQTFNLLPRPVSSATPAEGEASTKAPAWEGRPSLAAFAPALAEALLPRAGTTSFRRVRDQLADLAADLHPACGAAERAWHAGLLHCLTNVFQRAMREAVSPAARIAAPGYAALVRALFEVCPELDYRSALDQLLELMTQLFRARHDDWSVVCRHLWAIAEELPENDSAPLCTAEMREWLDAGVQNLFALENGIDEELANLVHEAKRLAKDIRKAEADLGDLRRETVAAGGKVLFFAQPEKVRALASLRKRRREVLAQRRVKRQVRELIRSDIAVFEGHLHKARRARLLRAV